MREIFPVPFESNAERETTRRTSGGGAGGGGWQGLGPLGEDWGAGSICVMDAQGGAAALVSSTFLWNPHIWLSRKPLLSLSTC